MLLFQTCRNRATCQQPGNKQFLIFFKVGFVSKVGENSGGLYVVSILLFQIQLNCNCSTGALKLVAGPGPLCILNQRKLCWSIQSCKMTKVQTLKEGSAFNCNPPCLLLGLPIMLEFQNPLCGAAGR